MTDEGLAEIDGQLDQKSYCAANGYYELRVVATGIVSSPSEGFRSEITVARPVQTLGFSNPNNAGTSVELRWETLPGAKNYMVKISRDGGESWTTMKKGLAGNSVRVTAISSGNMFRVYGFDAGGKQMKSFSQGTFTSGSDAALDDAFAGFFDDDELSIHF